MKKYKFGFDIKGKIIVEIEALDYQGALNVVEKLNDKELKILYNNKHIIARDAKLSEFFEIESQDVSAKTDPEVLLGLKEEQPAPKQDPVPLPPRGNVPEATRMVHEIANRNRNMSQRVLKEIHITGNTFPIKPFSDVSEVITKLKVSNTNLNEFGRKVGRNEKIAKKIFVVYEEDVDAFIEECKRLVIRNNYENYVDRDGKLQKSLFSQHLENGGSRANYQEYLAEYHVKDHK